MHPFVIIKFESGHTYQVAAQFVLEGTVAAALVGSAEDPIAARARITAEFDADPQAVTSAAQGLGWPVLVRAARLVDFAPIDFAGMLPKAKFSATSGMSPNVEAFGTEGMQIPLEMLFSINEERQHNCGIVGFAGPVGGLNAAAVAIIGEPVIVEGYIAAIKRFDEFMNSRAIPVDPQAKAATSAATADSAGGTPD